MRSYRFLALAAYLVGASLILIPLADAILSIAPFQIGEVRWRFGAAGMLANAFLIPNAGLLLLLATAVAAGHTLFRRVVGIAAFVGVGLAVIAIGVFVLDTIQMQANIRPDIRRQLWLAAASGGMKMLLETMVLFVLGLAGMSGSRAKDTRNADITPLLVSDQAAPAQR